MTGTTIGFLRSGAYTLTLLIWCACCTAALIKICHGLATIINRAAIFTSSPNTP